MRVFLVLVVFLKLRGVLDEKVLFVLKVVCVVLCDSLLLKRFFDFVDIVVFIVGFSDIVIFFFYL